MTVESEPAISKESKRGRASFRVNAQYALLSSLVTLGVNAILLALLPRVLSIEGYGYLQLYLLYSSYVGLAHLGLVDGVYLEVGGQTLEGLDRQRLSGVCWVLVISQMFVACGVLVGCQLVALSNEARLIWSAVALCVVVTNVRFFFVYLLQATASAAQAALSVIVDRGAYVVLVGGLAFADRLSLEAAIMCDLATKALSLIVSVYSCRCVLTLRGARIWRSVAASAGFVAVGSQLLLANLASSFVIGAARLGVQETWSVREFAFVSLALNVALVGVSVVNSVGRALFPFLRRIKGDQLARSYRQAREAISPLLLMGLIAYLPMKELLIYFVPKYASSAAFLGLILPVLVFEGVLSLLTGQMMRTLRMESKLLLLNVAAVVGSVGATAFGCLEVGSIDVVLLGLVLVLGARSMGADCLVARRLGIAVPWVVYVEMLLVMLFLGDVLVGRAYGWPAVLSSVVIFVYCVFQGPKVLRFARGR